MNNQSETTHSPAIKSELASLVLDNSNSVWKDRSAAFIEIASQIDDISWARIARQTGNQKVLELACLGSDARKQKFDSVAAKSDQPAPKS